MKVHAALAMLTIGCKYGAMEATQVEEIAVQACVCANYSCAATVAEQVRKLRSSSKPLSSEYRSRVGDASRRATVCLVQRGIKPSDLGEE